MNMKKQKLKQKLAVLTMIAVAGVYVSFSEMGMQQVYAAGSVDINEANFPDEVFRNKLREEYDKDQDGVLSESELAVDSITVSACGIKDLSGIEYFVNLKSLNCHDNELESLDVSKNTALEVLTCMDNELNSLNLERNDKLRSLWCYDNELESLDVSKNTALTSLQCSYNLSLIHI